MRDDASADRSARLLGAEAVAVGDQILFRSGRYAPNTEPGRALIAHELAHVAHQGQSGRPHPQRSVATAVPSVHFTQAMAEAMADTELDQQMQLLGAHLAVEPDDLGAAENLAVLEEVARGRPGMVVQASLPAGPAPAAPVQPGNVPEGQAAQVTAASQQVLHPDIEDAPERPGAVAPGLLLGFDPLVPDPEPTGFEQKLRSNQPFALRMMPQPDIDPRQVQWLGHQPTAAELAQMRPEAAGELPASTSIFVPGYSFESTVSGSEAMPIRDPKTHALLGYGIHKGATVYRVDRNGVLMGSQGTEMPLEKPLVDPIDVAFIAADVGPLVAKGIVAGAKSLGRAALKGAAREASEAETKLMAREVTTSLQPGAVKIPQGDLTPPTHQLPPHIKPPPPPGGPAGEISEIPGAFTERGLFMRTEQPSFVVRAGPPGSWGDHIFSSAEEANAYAEQLAAGGEASIREASALPRVWSGGQEGNPVDAIRVFEVPSDTPYIQGVVGKQLEGGTVAPVPRIYGGGGPQVVIPRNVRLGTPLAEFPVTTP